MTTIHLHDSFGKALGFNEIQLAIGSVGEALRALETLTHKAYQFLHDSSRQGVEFEVVLDGEYLDEDTAACHFLDKLELHFVPVVTGQGGGGGNKGVLTAIAGVALIGLAIFTGGASLVGAAMLGAKGATGMATLGIVGMMGVSLVMSGISQLLAPVPKPPGAIGAAEGAPLVGPQITASAVDSDRGEDTSTAQSYMFSGATNSTQQGGPVPICYGELVVGSQVISTRFLNKDIPVDENLANTGQSSGIEYGDPPTYDQAEY